MKIKKYLIFILVVLVVISIILLFANDGAFKMIVPVIVFTIATTLIYCICRDNLNFWNVVGVLFISTIVYVYALGWLIVYTCPKVIFVKENKERIERCYLPTARTLGTNRVMLNSGTTYIMNQTKSTLYFSKVAYGDKNPVKKNLFVLKENNVISTSSFGDDYVFRWFISPSDKIRIPKHINGEYVIYIDYQPYE